MNLLRAAWLLTLKDVRIYVRDRAALCLGFLVPMALVTVFGWVMTFAFGSNGGMPTVELWIVDEAQSAASKELIQSLRESDSLKIRPRENAPPLSLAQGRSKVADGDAHHVLVIPRGYNETNTTEETSNTELTMLRDPGRNMEDRLIQMALMQSMMSSGNGSQWKTSMRKLFQKQGMGGDQLSRLEKAMESMQSTIGDFVGDTVDPTSEPAQSNSQASTESRRETVSDPFSMMSNMMAIENEDIQPPSRPKRVTFQQAQSVAGMTVMMLLFGLSGAGAILIAEKEMGTLKRLFGMAMPKESVLLGKFLFLALLGVSQMVVLFIYGELMFRVGMFRDPITLAVIVLTWVAAASSFGMFIATFSKSAKQADSLATILILTMAALGGCWFPLQMMNLPLAMDVITKSMMTYWAMEALQGLLWNNLNLLDSRMLLALGIQWCWTLALGGLAVFFYRRNYCRS
jgi:ABC-2 type transport system permease protein